MDFNQEHPVDLCVRKTREAIMNTFKEMICEMPVEKITVRELTDRARIHRKPFYLHYTTIEALYQDMMSKIADGYFTTNSMPLLCGATWTGTILTRISVGKYRI